jgi:hypothetical protein
VIQPDINIVKAIIELNVRSPEMFRIIGNWIRTSLVNQALEISEVIGDENTNIVKGKLKELKQFDAYFNNATIILKSMEKDAQSTINASDAIS